MLVLGIREGGEAIITIPPGDRARTVVVKVFGRTSSRWARVGFEAERDIIIHRKEAVAFAPPGGAGA